MNNRRTKSNEPTEMEEKSGQNYTRVTLFIVALENYRTPSTGEPLPSVDFAHADADSFAQAINKVYAGFPNESLSVKILKDADASLTAVRDELKYNIHNLVEDELFIFYYAGHGFHGAGGNRLSAYDTNRTNIENTSLSMRDDLLEPLSDSKCRQALVFVDACAEKFRRVLSSRDVISNLDEQEVEEFLNNAWYLGVFLSCSPGEKSYPSAMHKHGIWTHFLLEAIEGRAPSALTRDRWLTDFGLRDYLHQEVPRYLTRELQIRGTQTPQAIISGSSSFRIHYIPLPPAMATDATLAGISLRNNSEFLEGATTGKIRSLAGFIPGKHSVPQQVNDSAESWCQRLLTNQVEEELQTLYKTARKTLNAKRKDLQKVSGTGSGDLDTNAFRYSIQTGQNPNNPSEYIIWRRLELREGWSQYRDAIDKIFSNEFDLLVIGFDRMDDSFDTLVERLEDIQESQGGEVSDDDRTNRVTYELDGVSFTFDLTAHRLEIDFGKWGALELVDEMQKFQIGISQTSHMLGASSNLPSITHI